MRAGARTVHHDMEGIISVTQCLYTHAQTNTRHTRACAQARELCITVWKDSNSSRNVWGLLARALESVLSRGTMRDEDLDDVSTWTRTTLATGTYIHAYTRSHAHAWPWVRRTSMLVIPGPARRLRLACARERVCTMHTARALSLPRAHTLLTQSLLVLAHHLLRMLRCVWLCVYALCTHTHTHTHTHTGFSVKRAGINPGAPGFVYPFYPHKSMRRASHPPHLLGNELNI